MGDGYSLFVILGTLGSLVGFFALLHLNRHVSHEGETTGHNYDGIEEYDNPLPAWWYWMFVLTIVFALGYLIYYPGLGNFPGVSGWTQQGELATAQQEAAEKYGPIFEQYRDTPVDELADVDAAMKIGSRLFATNCAICHGATGEGSFGFPDLTDSEWLWGGAGSDIETTIARGRQAAMLAWLDVLGEDGAVDVTEYVLSLSGRSEDDEAVRRGKPHFMTFCVACHGPEGKGMAVLGAPDLTNDIWLYGGSRDRIEHVIKHGRNGVMPAFESRLGSDKVHILAAYVRSLGR